MAKYPHIEIDLRNKSSVHTKIINFVGHNKRVLEFGCASGYMAKILSEEFGCKVVGIEISPESAALAKKYCERVLIEDIECYEWYQSLRNERFDVAIFGDILEHLKNPGDVLLKAKELLIDDGYIIISVPNIANLSVRLDLLSGIFEYEELGILDESHLRHFTLKSLIKLIEGSGFYLENIEYIVKDIPSEIITERLQMLGLTPTEETFKYFDNIESRAFQFVAKAGKKEPPLYKGLELIKEEKIEKVVDQIILEQKQIIQEKNQLIDAQAQQIQAKEAMIQAIRRELDLATQSKAWRMANFLRTRIFNRLSNYLMLSKKLIKTARREGVREAYFKTRRYLSRQNSIFPSRPGEDAYEKWMEKNKLTAEKIKQIKRDINQFNYKPKISIVMPVYNVEKKWLAKAIESVINQLYENWELCIADDASTEEHIKKTLEYYGRRDKRIKIKYLEENQGISGASNEALSLATGEFIGLLDHDDELSLDALYENVKLLNENPDADLIYSDEDKIGTNGLRMEPFFKPDYSPDMLLSINYIGHFVTLRKSLLDEIGGFRKGYAWSEHYDLFLRFIEKTIPRRILHIPRVIYHSRRIDVPADNINVEDIEALDSGKRALEDYLNRNGISGNIHVEKDLGCYRVKREIKNSQEVSIIIPFRDKISELKKCVNSIIEKTTYQNYRLFLIDNNSEEEETLVFLERKRREPIISVIKYNKSFNFSAINNYAAEKTESPFLLFLNNDTKVISGDWLEAMLEFAQRQDVGAVGALLFYPNSLVQHGGVIIGLGGVAGHAHRNFREDSNGYCNRLKMIQNLSAVTGACLLTRREVFREVGGFDENFSHAYNDVDFCLKIRERGYLIVYTPYAKLIHHEYLTRGHDGSPEKNVRYKREIKYFQEKWKEILRHGDPYYNPNLTLEKEDFSVKI